MGVGGKRVNSALVICDDSGILGSGGGFGSVLCSIGGFSLVVADLATKHTKCGIVVIVTFLDLAVFLELFSFYKGRTDGS